MGHYISRSNNFNTFDVYYDTIDQSIALFIFFMVNLTDNTEQVYQVISTMGALILVTTGWSIFAIPIFLSSLKMLINLYKFKRLNLTALEFSIE